ncbi:MAG TPA: phenylalanine--tRNA ligase subunit beta [Candidatus Saccharimonadales bacterium]|nr:phenylalanine--tRNA ligase subunit beta [Candidatus Saccharimonadales bacterium]
MNILVPVSWLREYLKTDVAAKTVASFLTASGPSVERIEKNGEDQVFDVEVTTNRPDAYSIYGMAREANAILVANGQKSQLIEPAGINQSLEPDTKNKLILDVSVDKKLCPRFTAIIIDNVKIGPSPALIKNRLEACGIRPINNIVDITNYIMLELGQPMHAFDYDKIKGSKMTLRESKEGESVRTLDGTNRKLPKGTIVIQDAEKLIDLCGIMGGENSAISTRTKRVILFAQSYDQIRVRKTTQVLAFRTDAAARFEKGIDLEGILKALKKSVALAKKNAGAKIASELIDIYAKPKLPIKITLSAQKLNNYLGIELPIEKAAKILTLLGFEVKTTAQNLTATPPSYRVADVELPEDLIEEVARVYGYHSLPSKLPSGEIPSSTGSILENVIAVKKALKFLGLTEIISYSIISKELLALTQIPEKDAVELSNPLSTEWQFMRPTIVPSLLQVVAQNQNLRSNLKLFEIAKTYLPAEASAKAGEKVTDGLPKQNLKVAFVLQNSSFEKIKGLVENLFEIIKREPKFEKFQGQNPLSENSQFAIIKCTNQTVGGVGVLKQSVADALGIEGSTFIAEIDLTTCYQLPATNSSYKSIPKFPPVIEDISAIFDEKQTASEIITEVKRAGEPLVKNIEIVDIFRGDKIGKGKKSVTLRLTYQEKDGTPKQEEVTRFRGIITGHLESYLKAQVRK